MNNTNKHGRNAHKSNKAAKIVLFLIIGLIVIGIIILACLYMTSERYYGKHFLKGTVVNEIDVSDMTIEELNQKIKLFNLTITERTSDGDHIKETLSGDEVGLELASTDFLEQILASQKKGKWITKKGQTYTVDNFVRYDETFWKQCMGYLKCFSSDFQEKPTDAFIKDYDEDENTFMIEPETNGNHIKKKEAQEILSNAVLQLEPAVDFEEYDIYSKPKVYSDDRDLNARKNNLNHFVNVTITYTFGNTIEVVDGDLIHKWVIANDDHSITLDRDKVDEYVASLRKKYDTIFRSRTFMTSYGEEVTLGEGNFGDYGWWMNSQKTADELATMIENGQSGDLAPVYIQTAAEYGSTDYGDTYVEVNLTAQHMFYYEDGTLVLESDFVSGNSSKGNGTPPGVYGITYKQRNATLVGEDYETPVSYWMPFNKHVGLHDATWRGKFGSEIYKTGGSHGCVNLPYAVAKELYSKVSQGTPVICYNLDGTKSDSITIQTAEEIARAAIDRITEIGAVTKDSEKAITRARVVYDELNAEEKKLVSNYDVLVAAEETYKELTNK